MSDKIIQLNEDLIKHDLKDLVRNSVEETIDTIRNPRWVLLFIIKNAMSPYF